MASSFPSVVYLNLLENHAICLAQQRIALSHYARSPADVDRRRRRRGTPRAHSRPNPRGSRESARSRSMIYGFACLLIDIHNSRTPVPPPSLLVSIPTVSVMIPTGSASPERQRRRSFQHPGDTYIKAVYIRRRGYGNDFIRGRGPGRERGGEERP